jgi:hypothetical protein
LSLHSPPIPAPKPVAAKRAPPEPVQRRRQK